MSRNDQSNQPDAKRRKVACEMKDRCYRKKEEHFIKYSHPHLEQLLSEIGSGPITIPENHDLKISKITLIEQLELIRKLMAQNGIDKPIAPPASLTQAKVVKKEDHGDICSFGENCYRKNPHHFQYYRHPHLEKIVEKLGEKDPDTIPPNMSLETLKEQLSFVRKFQFNMDPPPSESQNKPSTSTSSPSSDKSSRKVSKNQHEKNLIQENKMRVVVLDRTKQKIRDKMKLAYPYNFFLTTISDSPPTHTEMNSVCFPELVDPTLGDLVSSLQMNFMVQFGWVLAQYQVMGHRCKPMTLIYGDVDMEVDGKFPHFLTSRKVTTPSPFGSHHTKLMVFCYKDDSIRIVITTANLVESDWDNRTQGLWISPKCKPLKEGSDTMAGDSLTNFKRDFVRYLSSYKLPELVPWIARVNQCDLSEINVFFVSSVPGTHTVNKHLWGQTCLSKILNDNIEVPERNSYPVIVQCSSIGSLGPNPDSWLMSDMLKTFSSGKKTCLAPLPPLKFVYPSYDNILHSHDGLLGGGCLPYSKKTHDKQPWITGYMSQWKSDKRHRTKAPPHIKTYCRVSPDNSKLSYFLLTSANLSKAAWGNLSKSGSLNILSYEAGVLFLPQFVLGTEYFPLTAAAKQEDDIPLFPMPYDLPLTTYELTDVPWIIDHIL